MTGIGKRILAAIGLLQVLSSSNFVPAAGAADGGVTVGVMKNGQPIKAAIPVGRPSAPQKLDLPADNGSLWYRYYQAGEDAAIAHHDPQLAKRYYLASLAELEKHPQPKHSDMFLSIRLSALEKGLMDGYPGDWSTYKGARDDKMKLLKEQVDVYYRIARINAYYAPPDDLFRTKAEERYVKSKAEYEKSLKEDKSSAPGDSEAKAE